MKRSKFLMYVILTLLLLAPSALAQENADPIDPIDPDMVNPEAHISFPPPVYVVRDSVDIYGAVTLEAMRNFFVEFRPLALDMMADSEDDNQWFPATLPRIEAVSDDVLGVWNTVTLRDGIYELRLTINTGGDMPEYFRVSPIRVENNPPAAAADQQMEAAEPEAAETAPDMDDDMEDDMEQDMDEDAAPEPEPTEDPRPRVTATVNSNVRAGDSTVYQVIGHLLDGQSALIKGISSRGTGWYYIELANGRSGFIYPGIVNTSGDLSNMPRINPPPPPPPTPVPIPTAVPPPPPPQSSVDLVIHHIQVHPHGVECGETYEIEVTIRNAGSANAPNGGLIEVRDSGANGTGAPQTTTIPFGAVAAGALQTVGGGFITPTVHVETLHHINATVDYDNRVAEFEEGNNTSATAPYWLRGSC